MQFDFEQFTKRFKRAYPVARYGRRKQNDGNDCDLFSYDEALEVFREYFLAYEYYTGTAHPQLKREKIIDIIQRMDVGETPETCPYDDAVKHSLNVRILDVEAPLKAMNTLKMFAQKALNDFNGYSANCLKNDGFCQKLIDLAAVMDGKVLLTDTIEE